MRRLTLAFILFPSVFYVTSQCAGQSQSGPADGMQPTLGSVGEFDSINLANLNILVHVPIRGKTGAKALPLNFQAVVNHEMYMSACCSQWAFAAKNGNFSSGRMVGGLVISTTSTVNCTGGGTGTLSSSIGYKDQTGAVHNFPIQFNTCSPAAASGVATDGSGFTMTLSSAGLWTLYSVSGNYVTGGHISIASPIFAESDTNGNTVSRSTSSTISYTDSLGQIAVTHNNSGGWPGMGSSTTWTDVNGGTPTVAYAATTLHQKTVFACGQFTDVDIPSATFPSSATLPDGSVLTMKYESTPNNPGDYTGRLGELDLPTGGIITYAYSGGTNNVNCLDGTPHTLKRSSTDGTWTFTHTPTSGSTISTTVVVDPGNNETDYTFAGQYEVQHLAYQGCLSGTPGCVGSAGRTLVETVLTCFNGNFVNCASTAVNVPITRIDRYRTPASGTTALSETFLNTYGLTTQENEFDFGINTGAPPTGTPISAVKIVYASLGNNINNRPSCIQLTTGSSPATCGTVTSSTTGLTNFLNYDSRGNVGTIQNWVRGGTFLSRSFVYNANGTMASATDVNGAVTNYFYNGTGGCNNLLLTSTTLPVSNLSPSQTWNCIGGVLTSTTDPNSQTTNYGYTSQAGTADPFWRMLSVTDPLGNITRTTYSPTTRETSMVFNNGASAIDTIATVDGLGRSAFVQKRQAPNSANFDSIQYTYGWTANTGRFTKATVPYVGTQGQQAPNGTPVTTTQLDALSRRQSVTDGGGGSTSFQYTKQDLLITLGPPPTGENAKRRQIEYDSVGRMKSVCEISSGAGSGSCGQVVAGTGYSTTYSYSASTNITSVSQNAQGSPVQTRTFAYDGLGRLTSENNPEWIGAAANYTYDTDSAGTCSGTYNGDLVKKVDAAGNVTCAQYDGLHRSTTITYPSGPNASATSPRTFQYDSTTFSCPAGTVPGNVAGRLAEAYTGTSGSKTTDVAFCYSARGELTDEYQSTLHSGGLFHITANYWANGALQTLNGLLASGSGFVPTETYSIDGEGRWSSVAATTGPNPITSTSYNPAGQITGLTYGSSDTDSFTYYATTNRMNKYTFTVNGLSDVGTLTWNANGTLQSLAISDALNSNDNQTCNYGYDDLARITSANCGTPWSQTFSFDPFGNITTTGSLQWQPGYNQSTNRYTLAGTTYDANGNLTNDTFRSYAWDSNGRPTTIGTKTMTYDALGRMAEKLDSGTYTQFVYSPSGALFALMNGQAATSIRVPLPGARALYSSTNTFNHYEHLDWLGNSRLSSNQNRTVASDMAYAPYGEPYASTSTLGVSFTGMRSDVVSVSGGTTNGLYDAEARELPPTQGRWLSPDPAGLAAVDPSNPQSWNRYAYVTNSPLTTVDPSGLLGSICEDSCEIQGLDFMTPSNCWLDNDTTGFGCPMGRLVRLPFRLPIGTYILGDRVLPGEDCQSCFPPPHGDLITTIWQDVLNLPTLPCGGSSFSGPWCNSDPMVPIILDGAPEKELPCDDSACLLARAMNKTGIQAMQNPCTYGAWYAGSAMAGSELAGVGAEEGTAEMAGEEGLFPELADAMKNSKLLKYWNKAKGWVGGAIAWGHQKLENGCNAME